MEDNRGTWVDAWVSFQGVHIAHIIGGQTYFAHADQVGTTFMVTDENGNVVQGAAAKVSPARGAGASGESGEGGSDVASLGLVSRDVAPRQPGSPTFSFCHAAGLGGPRMAGTSSPAAREGGAAGRMARRRKAAHQVQAGSTRFPTAWAAAFRSHRQSPLADLTGLSRIEGELGLDHYEGHQWLGWHHHVCLVTMAYAFLRFEQARLKKTSGATWSLPRVRRQLLARLIRLSGRCAWCLTEFTDTS